MPLYAYECTACDMEFDVKQGFDEADIGECPECGGLVMRIFTPSYIIFKGKGFYTTDNVNAKPAK